MIVANWMTKDPKTIDADAMLLHARGIMEAGRFRCLPVLSKGNLVGVLSERDVRPHEAYLKETKVNAAMTAEPATVSPGDPLEKVARILIERKIGSLPVMEGAQLVGIITVTDVLKAFLEFIGGTEAGTMRIGVVLSDSSATVASAEKLIKEGGGNLLSLGTLSSPPGAEKVYYFKIRGGDSTSIVSRLKTEGYRIVDVQTQG
jgi:acetoin utilization protein AcuB